ncbi:PIN domain-containing protein [Salinibacter ruber]|uniref:PIN domain-containing protein n=1 Tax=Salinibacter ruber TaxID=146919 RepID=UPI0020736B2D|nr:PIN-like domain-containing protein [Salinibacter ruber]
MQDRFPWFVQPSDEEFERLWQEGTFVFDANILLDLYRRSRSFKEDFFNVLEELDGRIWLPHQVAEEFMRNRPDPISSQLRNFEKAEEEVNDWWERLRELSQLRDKLESVGDRKGPIEREIDGLLDDRSDFQEAAEAFKDQVLNSLEELRENLLPSGQRAHPTEDDTLRKLEKVFNGRVGDPYGEERLEEIYEDGKERYADEIPPGFGDADKDDPSRKFADLVIWEQILGYASDHEKDIVFVTRDTEKEDWWEENSGRTVGPLPYLRKEFREEAGARFWMYQGPRFLDRAKDELQVEVKDTSIEEARQQEAGDVDARKFRKENLAAIGRAMLQMQEASNIPAKELRETLQRVGMSVDEMHESLRQAQRSQIPLAEIQSALAQMQGSKKFFEDLHQAQEVAQIVREIKKRNQFPGIPQSDSGSPEDSSESDQESQDNSGSPNG